MRRVSATPSTAKPVQTSSLDPVAVSGRGVLRYLIWAADDPELDSVLSLVGEIHHARLSVGDDPDPEHFTLARRFAQVEFFMREDARRVCF